VECDCSAAQVSLATNITQKTVMANTKTAFSAAASQDAFAGLFRGGLTLQCIAFSFMLPS